MLYTKDCTAKSILVKFLGTSACVFTENVFCTTGHIQSIRLVTVSVNVLVLLAKNFKCVGPTIDNI